MNELTERLSARLDRLADTAQARRDLDGVMAGRGADLAHVTTSGPKHRVLAQVAAAAILIAGVGALVTVTAVQDPPAAQSPVATEPAQTPLPVMPGSEAGTRLLVECLNDAGLDVQYDASDGQPAVTFDNSIVDEATFDVANRMCNDDLVRASQIYGLGPDAPTGPGIAVVPGSVQGTRLLGDCLIANGLDVEVSGSAIAYDNRIVGQTSYDAVFEACTTSLVADGKIVPLLDEPIPATTTVESDPGPASPVSPAETGILRASVETEVGLFEIFDQIPTGETCQQLKLGDATTSTCYDRATMDDQMAWSVIGTDDGGDLLYGLVSPSAQFSVVVAGQTIVPDENGIWYATIPDDVRTATLGRAVGPTQIDW